ncbi:DUF6449 domain-containing protein [Natranaerofaba carboxydovora]|uniref:DUF6449 domain-containing protein n=1 Tax=Natranaerofaba carboxydovora TaxID=2742683 RepID=UPI001F12F672|nr:DUF6449 domain-containing protein [Natranaerofaba carboxydovora]UMZ72486.1 hypothetical protein ACONDI_00005 [Natranaerofaba carboxydovora]
MKHKTSLYNSFNKGLITSNLKRFWWVSALYTILLFFALPLRLIMQLDVIHEEWVRRNIQGSLDLTLSQNQIQILLIFIVPVIVGVLVFRYLQQGYAASMIHSLPFTRKDIFFNQAFSGLVLIAFPIIFNGIFLLIFQATTSLGEIYSSSDVFSWAGYSLLFLLLMYNFSVFIGMFTGNSIAQLAFNYILHLLPLGVFILFQANITHILHGYSRSSLNEPSFLENIPFAAITSSKDLNELIIWYLIFTTIFFIGSYYSYKFRNIEVAGDVISFQVVKPIFKYGVTLCSMLLGGAYFTSISTGGFITVFFGYIFSSLLGYFIAEMLIQKSYKVSSAYKGYLVYIVIVLLAFTGIQADVIGFVGRVPEPEEVKSVYFGHGLHHFQDVKKEQSKDFQNLYKEKENIDNIINLHKELIEEGKTDSGGYRHIIYTLEDGSHLIREYRIDDQRHASLLKPIYESMEYKINRYPMLEQDPAHINRIELRDTRAPDEKTLFLDDEETEEFATLLQEEIKGLSYEDLIDSGREYIYATITKPDGTPTRLSLKESYNSIFKWLEENNYYERFVVSPDDINYVVLENTRRSPDLEQKQVEIRDPQVIEEILSLLRHQDEKSDGEYVFVGLYQDERHPYFQDRLLIDDNISSELEDNLNQLGL